jgi:hypothetical protein
MLFIVHVYNYLMYRDIYPSLFININICVPFQVEEEELDRQQEGGPNPSVSEDAVRFDFSTGRLPRRIASRGDAVYKTDEVIGKYLSVCPLSMLFATLPVAFVEGEGSCGGRRLNRYSVVLEVMLEELPRVTGSDATAAGTFSLSSTPTLSRGLVSAAVEEASVEAEREEAARRAEGGQGRGRESKSAGETEVASLIPIFSTAPYAESEVRHCIFVYM